MADWITVPPFTSGQIVRASTFQDVWENLSTLKDPLYVQQQLPGPDGAEWSTTDTVDFTDIDPDYYQLSFTSYGNDVLLVAFIRARFPATGRVTFGFSVDGIFKGNSSGIGEHHNTSGETLGETYCFTYVLEGLAAGSHTASVQVKNLVAGTATLYQYSNLKFWAMEF